jgi:hypothetical protein
MWVYFDETCVSAWKRGWGSSLLHTTSHHIAYIDYGSSGGINPVIKVLHRVPWKEPFVWWSLVSGNHAYLKVGDKFLYVFVDIHTYIVYLSTMILIFTKEL